MGKTNEYQDKIFAKALIALQIAKRAGTVTNSAPMYMHDCEDSIFLDNYNSNMDLYFNPSEKLLTVRYNSAANNFYWCYTSEVFKYKENSPLRVAYEIASKKRLI